MATNEKDTLGTAQVTEVTNAQKSKTADAATAAESEGTLKNAEQTKETTQSTSISDETQSIIDAAKQAKTASIEKNTDGTIQEVSTDAMKQREDAIYAAAAEQAQKKIDYATQQSIDELQRAEEDAAEQYQTQRNQIDIDEAKAKSNQALYAEARGDKGGIGAAQYSSIMNTAATNRLTVQKEQTKLATDTARQIADLRAQGEYQKADSLLSLTQTYLSELNTIDQWGISTNMSIADFNEQVAEWEKSYEIQVANLTGYYNGSKTLALQQYEKEQLASQAESLLAVGQMPSDAQLSAYGWTKAQAQAYINSISGASTSSSSATTTSASQSNEELYDQGSNGTSAVMALQKYFGVTQDGVVGPVTWGKITDAGYDSVDAAYNALVAGGSKNYDGGTSTAQQRATNEKMSQIYSNVLTMVSSKKSQATIAKYLQSYIDSGAITETAADNMITRATNAMS